MKRLAYLLVLFASFCSLPAATVTGLVQNVRSVAAAGMRIQLTPTNTPVVIDGVFYHSSPVLITVAADGTFSVSNLITGTYRSRPGDLARDAVSLCVPNDSNTYNWTSIICDGSPSTLTNLPIYVRGVAQGTNGILTVTNSTGVVTVHFTGSSGGGSGDVTTAQLNTASNALSAQIVAKSNFVVSAHGDAHVTNKLAVGTNSATATVEVQGTIKSSGTISTDGSLNAASGSATVAAGGALRFNGRSAITSPVDGVLGLANNALSSFAFLGFGGQKGISNAADGFRFTDGTGQNLTNLVGRNLLLTQPGAGNMLALDAQGYLTNATIGSGLSYSGTSLRVDWAQAASQTNLTSASNALVSLIGSSGQTPWTATINGAGYPLTNSGNLTSTGTVTAAEFVGMDSTSSGSLTLQATNPTGAITFTLPATSTASNNFSFHFSSITAGDVFKVHSVSGNNVVMTNAVDNNSGGGGGGSSNLATVTITNSLRFGETNIIVDSTDNRLLDLSVWTMFRVALLTNATLTFTNVPASGLQRAQVLIQQDTNGQRTVDWAVAGGLLQTNATLQPTTNANALDLLEVASSYFPTNLLAWWPQNFQARVAFTNSLATAGGGGGGGLLPTPTAYWNFDASASSDEADQTGNGITLWQSNSAASVAGLIGNARSLQSNALQYFVASNSIISFSNTSWSIMTWQKTYPTNVAGGIVSRFINTFPNREWALYRQGSGGNNHRLYFYYGTNGASSYVQGNAATSRVPTNLWHLVGMVVDSTNLQIRTCVMWGTTTNWTTNSLAGIYSTNGNANLIFGRDVVNGLYNDGAVDESGYWKGAALNEEQMGYLFNDGSGRSYPW